MFPFSKPYQLDMHAYCKGVQSLNIYSFGSKMVLFDSTRSTRTTVLRNNPPHKNPTGQTLENIETKAYHTFHKASLETTNHTVFPLQESCSTLLLRNHWRQISQSNAADIKFQNLLKLALAVNLSVCSLGTQNDKFPHPETLKSSVHQPADPWQTVLGRQSASRPEHVRESEQS